MAVTDAPEPRPVYNPATHHKLLQLVQCPLQPALSVRNHHLGLALHLNLQARKKAGKGSGRGRSACKGLVTVRERHRGKATTKRSGAPREGSQQDEVCGLSYLLANVVLVCAGCAHGGHLLATLDQLLVVADELLLDAAERERGGCKRRRGRL